MDPRSLSILTHWRPHSWQGYRRLDQDEFRPMPLPRLSTHNHSPGDAVGMVKEDFPYEGSGELWAWCANSKPGWYPWFIHQSPPWARYCHLTPGCLPQPSPWSPQAHRFGHPELIPNQEFSKIQTRCYHFLIYNTPTHTLPVVTYCDPVPALNPQGSCSPL